MPRWASFNLGIFIWYVLRPFSLGHHFCVMTEYPPLKVRTIWQHELRKYPSQDWDACHQSVCIVVLHRFTLHLCKRRLSYYA